MGDPRRFDVFASFLERNFKKDIRIADVAGGKAYLQTALRQKGFQSVHTFDKRRGRKDRPKMRYSYRYFDDQVKEEFDLLIGMHPDEATDVIIVEAAKRKVPFVVVPCCIKPCATTFWGSNNSGGWLEHLERTAMSRGFDVRRIQLKMSGKNICLMGRPTA